MAENSSPGARPPKESLGAAFLLARAALFSEFGYFSRPQNAFSFTKFAPVSVGGFLWISTDFYGFLCFSVDFYGFLWISMDFYGFLRVSMDFYAFLWIGPRAHWASQPARQPGRGARCGGHFTKVFGPSSGIFCTTFLWISYDLLRNTNKILRKYNKAGLGWAGLGGLGWVWGARVQTQYFHLFLGVS